MRNFAFMPSAKIQVESLEPSEAAELERLLSSEPAHDTKRTDRGHFISRLGTAKRVLWQRLDDGSPVILSIVDRSYQVPA